MRASVVAAALAILLGAAHAQAESPRRGARLTWARGAGAERCVGLLGLQEDVKARLGYDPFVMPSELAIEGVIVRGAKGYRAELVIRDAADRPLGTRQLASAEAECRSLGEAVAVAITVAIDPEATGVATPLVEEVPSPSAPAPRPLPVPPPPSPAAPHGQATLGGGAGVGLVPGVAPLVSLRVRANVGERLELGVSAHFLPESQQEGIGYALTSGALEGCLVPWISTRWLRWCGEAHLGAFQVFVHAAELTPVEVGMFPWAGLGTGPALSLPLAGPIHLDVAISALVPLVRRQALVRGQSDPVWEQSVVTGRADLGLGARF